MLLQGHPPALDAAFTGRTFSDDLEEQELLLLSETELRQALLAGEFKVLPWTAILGLALHHIEAGLSTIGNLSYPA